MKISLDWLRDFVDVDATADEIAEKLTMAGLEVEAVESFGGDVERLLTARIRKIKPHPAADKLKVCEVDTGSETVDVVCGAPNIYEGMASIWAPPETTLPSGNRIKEAVIRGVPSQGMLCSLQELGLEEKSEGVHDLGGEVKIGSKAAPLVGLSTDTVIEIGVTPNRGDALSVEGVAREVAAAFGVPIKYAPDNCPESSRPIEEITSLLIQDPIGCPRYVARVIEGIEIRPSPPWMQSRLAASGVRAINNIVDITNYVMLEVGQPLHAFDMDRLSGPGIVVRRSRPGEKFVTLDEVERVLDDDLLICDKEKPVALAGVMGGLNSEVTDSTVNVLLEAACFDPTGIRRTSKRIGLSSEASYRFERGVDPCLQMRAANRASALMAEHGGGTVAMGALDDSMSFPPPPDIILRDERVKVYMGMEVPRDESKRLLESVGFEVKDADEEEALVVIPPTWRGDVNEEADIIEEVARLYGYDKLPVTLPEGRVEPVQPVPEEAFANRVRQVLVGAGYHEIVSLSFMNPRALDHLNIPKDDPRNRTVGLMNPLSSEESVMRTTLVPNLLNAVAHNLHRLQDDVRLFEVGRVFQACKGAPLPDEPMNLAGAMVPPKRKSLYPVAAHPFYRLKGAVEELLCDLKTDAVSFNADDSVPYLLPGQCASIIINGANVGVFGRLRPSVVERFDMSDEVYLFELDFYALMKLSLEVPYFTPLASHPPAFRDLAVVVEDAVQVADIERAIKSVDPGAIRAARVFDVYRGKPVPEGRKSVAFSIVYQWPDRSPVDEEVNRLHERITADIERKFGAKIR